MEPIMCDHPRCEKESVDEVYGFQYCAEHEEWAHEICCRREMLDDMED